MNLYAELERITAPAPVAGAVRTLSREEIEELAAAGAITDVRLIPQFHQPRRVSHPPMMAQTTYGKTLASRCRGGAL